MLGSYTDGPGRLIGLGRVVEIVQIICVVWECRKEIDKNEKEVVGTINLTRLRFFLLVKFCSPENVDYSGILATPLFSRTKNRHIHIYAQFSKVHKWSLVFCVHHIANIHKTIFS